MQEPRFNLSTISDLGNFIHLIPGPVYIKDTNSIYLYINQFVLEASGFGSYSDIIGKTDDMLWPMFAKQIVKHDQEVIKTLKPILNKEEAVIRPDGTVMYFSVVKMPLFDNNGNLIGIIGNSNDITDRKEKERLDIEVKTQKISAQLEEQKRFRVIADQMAHDLGSPLMALSVLTNNCSEIPEQKRNMLIEAASRIRDIAGNLLSQYKPLDDEASKNSAKELLVYPAIEQVIMDKQHEYQHLPIKFIGKYSNNNLFIFIAIQNLAFKRMLSNLVNNAVDAIADKSGSVTIELDSNTDGVSISICDTGSGMPQVIIDTIMNGITVTANKTDGHGIGFSQIRETLQQNNGKIAISSTLNVGTRITIRFSKIEAPLWIAEQITLRANDIILVLDDDSSIHGAWDLRFADILKDSPNIQVKHFEYGQDVISYVHTLSDVDKQRVLLLTDYELLKQNLNGLDVIKQIKIRRSILVTSHYDNTQVRAEAMLTKTQILPKILASVIFIRVK